MKRLILIGCISGILAAQQTRREEVTPSPRAADDLKANSDSVPDVYAMSGRFDRVVVLRLKFGTDFAGRI